MERLRSVDEEYCVNSRFEYISQLEAVNLIMNGKPEKNRRYIFKLKDSFAALFDDYFFVISKTLRENKKTYRIRLFIGDMSKESPANRVEQTKKLIFDNPRKYFGGTAGMLEFLGFYDFEPITLGKNGKIRKIHNCTPIENLFEHKSI